MAETFVPFEFARRIYAAARRRADAFRIADWRLCDPIVGEIVFSVDIIFLKTATSFVFQNSLKDGHVVSPERKIYVEMDEFELGLPLE
ncbi:hypothetical protein OUZ56_009427 [Daphnia magna]|uniref:Uncharacterized protein n=1 Tax=Daphnia magna TaxID=35525 RepID=A0ABR0AFZ7_9CRUS|nr:hypothetical protein OUZ56_009427 [Daphnia magna]